jgi:hypothetical protein
VIWFCIAFNTEILRAFSASYSIVSHMFSCSIRNWLTFIIFLAFYNISRNHLHYITALTTHKTRIKFNNLHILILFNDLQLFRTQKLFDFIIINLI